MRSVWLRSFATAVELAALMVLVPVVNAPPALAQGGLAPGVYVTSLRIDPAQPTPNVPISFYATFLNNSGPYSNVRWVVYIFLPGDFRHSIGETSKDAHVDIPVGTTELQALGAWKIGVGEPCRFYTAEVAWVDSNNKATPYQKPDGSNADFPLTVCDSWPSAPPPSAPVPAATSAPAVVPLPVPSAAAGPTPTTESAVVPFVAPPLADVDFPSQVITYPSDWPAELHYPDQFRLVAASSGNLPEAGADGCATKLVYAGSPVSAATGLMGFLTVRGWQITDRQQLDTRGLHLFIQRGSKPQRGVILIGSDMKTIDNTRILVIIYL